MASGSGRQSDMDIGSPRQMRTLRRRVSVKLRQRTSAPDIFSLFDIAVLAASAASMATPKKQSGRYSSRTRRGIAARNLDQRGPDSLSQIAVSKRNLVQ